MYNVIKIGVTQEELIDSLEENTEENRDYIAKNFNNIIDSEEEMLEEFVNDSGDAIGVLMTIRDNEGVLSVTNDDGKEIASVGYYAEIKL